MSSFDVMASFNAVDNISNVLGDIGGSFLNVAQMGLDSAASMTSGLNGVAGAVSDLAIGGFGLLASAIGYGINEFINMNDTMIGMQARLGATGDEMKGLTDVTKNVFASGFVTSFGDAAKAVETTQAVVKGLADDKALSEFATEAEGVGKAFGMASGEVEKGVGRLQAIFPELEGKPKEALDILVTTAQNAHKPLSEIENDVMRFGPKFALAGVSALGMGGLIVAASNAGLGPQGIGGLATAIDTFHQKVANPDAAFMSALKDLGLSSVAKDLSDNKITMDTALDEIFTAMAKPENAAKRSKDATELFGKAGIALSNPDVISGLVGFNKGLTDVDGKAQDVANTMNTQTSTAIQALTNKVSLFFAGIVETGAKVLLLLPALVNSIGDTLNKLITILITAWDNFWTSVQNLVNTKGEEFKTTIKAIVDAVSTWWYDNISGPRGIIQKVIQAINGLVDFVKGVAGSVISAFQAVVDPVVKLIQGIITAIQTAIDKLKELLGMGGGGGTGNPVQAYENKLGMGVNPNRELGGPIKAGQPYIVGEKGPELVVPDTNGYVMPNDELNSRLMGYPQSSRPTSFSGNATSDSGGTHIHLSVGTVVGKGGMEELARILYVKTESEKQRRGLTR